VKKWLYLAGAIGSEVTGTLALRAATDDGGWIALVVAGYVVAFVLLSAVLREGMAIGVAYGIWAATGVSVTAIMAAILFDEPLTWVMGLGFAVIVAGVLLVELGPHAPGPGSESEHAHTGPVGTR
jgi:small multidrug resistance pump